MLIEMWPDLVFDPSGTNPVNDIKDEEQKLTDKACPWIIPNGAPFKAGSVKIKDINGQILKTGWREVFKPMPLIEMTGLDINTFIELDDGLAAQYDSLFISYHSVGANFIPRNSLEEQLETIQHGLTPIPWSKVIQIPATLPSSYHWHSKEELMDWSELVLYVKYLVGVYQARNGKQMSITDIMALTKTTLDNLIAKYNLVNTNIIKHGSNYNNPHSVTAAMLLLQNIDNFATATIADDIAGTSNTLFSTSAGAIAVIKNKIPDVTQLLGNGLMPMSSLSADDYLPPVIDGSFEGLGTDNMASAMCLENNGRLVIVRRHSDGRTKALYFSIMDDYRSANTSISFTGFRYANAALTAQGYNLDTVMMGSGPDLIVAGDSVKGKWFGALTNGTLNPDTHNYKEFNLSNVPGTDVTGSSWSYCFKTKTYLFIAAIDFNAGNNNINFYRALVSDLATKSVITFTPLPVTFKDISGNQYTNSPFWTPDTEVKDAQGHTTKYINAGSPYFTAIGKRFNIPIFIYEESTDQITLRYMSRPIWYNTDANNWYRYASFEMTIRLNCATGLITTPYVGKTYTFNTQDNKPGDSSSVTSSFNNLASGTDFGPFGGIMTRNGDYIVLGPSAQDKNNPVGFYSLLSNTPTPAASMLKSTDDATLAANGFTLNIKSLPSVSPLQLGGSVGLPAFDVDGEFVPGLDIQSLNNVMTFRKVSGGFAQRPGVVNTQIPNLLGRPLVNTVYRTNLAYIQLMTTYTGTDAELATAGIEMGWANLASFGVASFGVNNWANITPGVNGIQQSQGDSILVPRTYNKVYNDDVMTMQIVPTTYYGITPTVLNQIKSMLQSDGSTSNYCALRINVPPRDFNDNPIQKGLPILVSAVWYSPSNGTVVRAQVLAINATISGVVNGVCSITAPTFIDASTINTNNNGASPNFFIPDVTNSHHFQTYKNGTVYTVNGLTGILWAATGGSAVYNENYTFDTATNRFTFSNLAVDGYGYIFVNSTGVVPRVGFGRPLAKSYTGGAAAILDVGTSNYYLVSSCYPDSGWTVYFKAGTKLIINGTQYDAPIGSVDLRDIDPSPANKTFYIYVTCYGDQSNFIVSGKKIRHNLSIVPAAEVITNGTQILTINRKSTFMLGDAIISAQRIAGSIPVSTGVPMDEGNLNYVYQSDLPSK